VFNKIFLLTGFYWLELYRCKKFFKLNMETSMEKIGTGKLVNLAEIRAGSLECWDGQLDVLVLSFGVGFEGASSGSVGLVAFRFFCG
jgi:hypothetical protein